MNRELYTFFFIFLFLTTSVNAQLAIGNSKKEISPIIFNSNVFACNVIVDAGNDTLICGENFPIPLNGSFIGNAVNYFWSPSVNVTDPSILNPLANSSGTYTLTVQSIDETNLVINGDFENGDSDFTTDYSTGTVDVGNYLISDTPQDYFNLFSDCDDHTTGSGNMMIVDGSDMPDQNIWCQTINISPNTDYYFSLWATMVGGTSPPELYFSVDGNVISDTMSIPLDNCLWTELSQIWNSGSSTSIEFCIVNNNISPFGNDFAIDDIFVAPICEVTDEVVITVLEAEAIVPNETIACIGDCIMLDGSSSTSGPAIAHEWVSVTGGNIQNGSTLTPIVCDTGVYKLIITSFDVFTGLYCYDSTLVAVDLATMNPANPIITGDDTLCIGDTKSYQINSPDPSTNSYDWIVTNGIILNGQNTTMVEVEWNGILNAEICVSAINSCAISDTICMTIFVNSPPVEPIISGSTNICNNPIASYSVLPTSNILNYQWTTPSGTLIQSGQGTDSIQMDWGSALGGDVCLLVENECGIDSSCVSVIFGSIQISLDSLNPLCPSDSNGWIKVTPLAGTSPFSFIWGNGEMTDSIGGLSAGTYDLTVSDNDGCSTEETIILQDPSPLNLTFSNTEISCYGECDGIISAEVTGGVSPFEFLWGNNLGTNDSLLNVCTGIYNITITDANGCTIEGQTQLDNPPLISAAISNDTTICQGENVNVIFQFTGIGPFDVELSDGSIHTNLVDEDMVSISPSTTTIISITSLVDQGQPNCVTNSTSTISIIVNDSPVLPILTGVDSTCQNTSLNYCITNTANVDSIHWTIPMDATFTGQNSDCIEINWANSNGGQVCIETINGCGSTQECMDVNVFPIPTSTFSVDPIICIDSTSTIFYSGSVSANAIFYWDFDGGNIIAGNDSESYEINWSIGGEYNITLTVEENGCQSDVFSQNIQVDETLETLIITCESTTQSIIFSWDDVIGATDYVINELSGIIGIQNGNSIIYNNLNPGQEISIEVVAVGNTICGNSSSTETCFANNCPTIDITIPSVDDICLSNTSLEIPLQAIVTGTDGSGIGSWSGVGIVDDIFDPSLAGEGQHELTYSFTELQCDFSESIFVNVFSQPIAEAGENKHLDCEITSVILDGNNSVVFGSFAWSTNTGNFINGLNTLSPEINAPGVYYLSIENSGCISVDSVVVTQNIISPIADAGLEQAINCNQTCVNLEGINTSQGNSFIYSWSSTNGFISSEISPQVCEAGEYFLTVLDITNNCISATSSVVILENNTLPIAQIEPIGNLDCNNTSLILNGSNSSFGNQIEYQWFEDNALIIGATNSTYEASEQGNYYLSVLDVSTGCFSIDTVFLNDNTSYPIAEITTPEILTCVDIEVMLDGSNSSSSSSIVYNWFTTTSGGIQSGEDTNQPIITEPGFYELIVLDTLNGCETTAPITVIQNIISPNADAGFDIELECNETGAMLGSGNTSSGTNFEYLWTSSNTNVIINSPLDLNPMVDGLGTYNLLVTNLENGCTASDEIEVSQNPNIPQNINFETIESPCYGDEQGIIIISTIDGGSPPYLYSLNGTPFSSSNIFNNLPIGDYEIMIQDSNGCELATMVTMNQPDSLSIDLGENIYLELGDSVMFDPLMTGFFDTIIWESSATYSNCDSLENCFNPIVTPIETTSMMATLINDNGCIAMDQVIIFVEKNRYVYIPNAFSPDGFSDNQIFMIYAGKGVEKINSFKVFSRWGEQMYEAKDFYPNDNSYGWDGNFKGERMKPGVYVYFAEIEFSDGLKIIYKGDVTLMR